MLMIRAMRAAVQPSFSRYAPRLGLERVSKLEVGVGSAWRHWSGTAPRSAAFSRAVGSSILSSSPTPFSYYPVCLSSSRSFAAAAAAAAVDSGLLEALEVELKHETKTYETPEELKGAPPAGFKVDSNPGAAEVIFRRTFKGEDIAITVSSLEEDKAVDFEGEEEEGKHEEEEEDEEREGEDEEEGFFLPVQVTVTKKQAGGLVSVLKIEGGIDVDNSWVIEEVQLESPHVPPTSIPYKGPIYSTLDAGLQEQFDAFLQRRGFSPELAQYIRVAVEDKEQTEYMAWLARVKAFISHTAR